MLHFFYGFLLNYSWRDSVKQEQYYKMRHEMMKKNCNETKRRMFLVDWLYSCFVFITLIHEVIFLDIFLIVY